ncbi:alpha/beta hydrolase [Pusillimonas sp. NJUB218]|uniref:alpha/beta hydrolase n=1 Tax=Pusillimonas sp. NJUB218 TaxID=2023230 RepID=UPI000F4BF61D|nr:alpha/beta hydrolase [Pusillimonas sp. NJUB218]ROT43920.1 alpha/beta hydrolase [Pusillimonas sp. NJUB218]
MSNSKATAGLRGASWDEARLPEGVATTVHTLTTADSAATTGFLFRRGLEKTVACLMHPREMLASHYLIPELLNAGVAVWNQGPRSVGNDLRLEHEIALFDVAAGLQHLKNNGFERIILVGLSGGASLYAFYQEQAAQDPAQRLQTTPGGRPVNLTTLQMPVADALVFVSPHPGQGMLLMNSIDPSVTDEADPFSCDAQLDPFNNQNGFRPPPEGANYAQEFIKRYRDAQKQRVARIDAVAREMIAVRQGARERLKKGRTRQDILKAAHTPVFNVWRTDADLRCWDINLDPSDRRVGSLWGHAPAVSNVGAIGFGRVCTPDSWLSTWSGLSSNASFLRCAPSIKQPTLMIEYTGDNAVFPSDIQSMFTALGAEKKQLVRVRGDHQGRALAPDEPSGQLLAANEIANWLQSLN